jgi:uncharacterized protein YdhG (YjbR/CyaY superfamily)
MTDGVRAVDEYIAALPEARREPMTALRGALVAAAPQADETIAYKMPALRLNGAFFMSYDSYKSHYSLFPYTHRMEEVLGDEIAPYVSGKGTLRFKVDQPLPLDLIGRIVEIRLEDFARKG